jgi:hypothetical protein
VDGIIGNNTRPLQKILDTYSEQKSDFVTLSGTDPFWDNRNLHLMNVLETPAIIVRHDPGKLSRLIQNIIHGA